MNPRGMGLVPLIEPAGSESVHGAPAASSPAGDLHQLGGMPRREGSALTACRHRGGWATLNIYSRCWLQWVSNSAPPAEGSI